VVERVAIKRLAKWSQTSEDEHRLSFRTLSTPSIPWSAVSPVIRECQGLLCIIGRTGDAVKLMTNCLMFGPLASRLPILHRKRDLVPLIERSLKTAKRGLVE
jgi:hypothetical protein